MKMAVIKGCFAVSAAFSLYYFATTHFEFMLSLFHYMKFNLSSISYTLIRILQVLFPVILFVPEKFTDKPSTLKVMLLLTGILYITGSSWILHCLFDSSFPGFGDTEAVKQYLQLNALNFGYLMWDSYDIFSVVFSLIQAAVHIALANCIACVRRKTIALYVTTTVLNILFPVLYVFVILGTGEFSSMFLQKNTVLIVAELFLCAGFLIAGTSRRLWEAVVWE